MFPDIGRIRVVWNGAVTENTADQFTRQYDFVEQVPGYIARDDRPSSFSLVDSYDRANLTPALEQRQ